MSKRSLTEYFWIFVLTYSVRLYVITRLAGTSFFIPSGGDMQFYASWGMRVAHGIFSDHKAFYGLPGYPFILGFLYRILNFDRFSVSLVAALLQSAADAFTAVFIGQMAIQAFAEADQIGPRGARAIGWMAAIGWALYQPAQAFSVVMMPTALAVAAYWYCVRRFMQRDQPFSVWKPWLPMGVLIGVVAMIVATVLFLIPMALAAIFLRYKEKRSGGWQRPGVAAAALLAGVYAGAAPCWIHNYFVAHEPVMLSAHSGLNFYIGNNPIATGYPKMPPGMSAGQQGMLRDSIAFAEKAEGRPLKHYEVSQYWSAKAHEYIAGHTADWLRLMEHKFLNFWDAYQYDDLSLVNFFSNGGILLPGPRFGLVAALAVPGLVLAIARRRGRAGWVLAAVLHHMGALMPVFVTERYRLAAVPGLLIFAAYGLWELWTMLTESRWVGSLAYGCGGAAIAFCIATPPADASLWSLDFYNTGIKASDQQDYATARRDLETAYRYVPENSEINFALGLLWQSQGESARAQTFYRRTLEINPRHVGAWNNLGVLAGEQKRWDIARNCFSRAVEIDPSDAKALYLKARACAQLADWAAAQESIDAALRLDPEAKDFKEMAEAIHTHGPVPER